MTKIFFKRRGMLKNVFYGHILSQSIKNNNSYYVQVAIFIGK